MNTPAPKPTVLIVDDTPDSLGLLNLLLKDHYRVKAALDGERALTLANAEPRPDLILLDIMMPGIDGFEVCRRLKANPPTAEIPVIFLTARSQVEDEQTGFDVGGVDYILKPVSPPIVEARVRTHLQNKAARDILKDQNAFLEAEVKKRTAEVLAAAEMKAQLAGLQQELEVARRMQASILPRALPPRREVEVAGVMIPAKEVGGDFYDYFLVDDRRLGIVVADVCGKGVPAAFFMAITRTLLRAHASSAWEPADCLTRLNEQLAAENDQMMFVTLFFGVLDLQTGELRYANAGHNPPLVRSPDGTLRPLDGDAGPALAIIDDYELGASRTDLARGDTLLLFTDGITEAFDVDQQAFGDDRLERLLRAMPADTTPSACAARIVAAVRTFARGEPQSDDITCVVLRYHGG